MEFGHPLVETTKHHERAIAHPRMRHFRLGPRRLDRLIRALPRVAEHEFARPQQVLPRPPLVRIDRILTRRQPTDSRLGYTIEKAEVFMAALRPHVARFLIDDLNRITEEIEGGAGLLFDYVELVPFAPERAGQQQHAVNLVVSEAGGPARPAVRIDGIAEVSCGRRRSGDERRVHAVCLTVAEQRFQTPMGEADVQTGQVQALTMANLFAAWICTSRSCTVSVVVTRLTRSLRRAVLKAGTSSDAEKHEVLNILLQSDQDVSLDSVGCEERGRERRKEKRQRRAITLTARPCDHSSLVCLNSGGGFKYSARHRPETAAAG